MAKIALFFPTQRLSTSDSIVTFEMAGQDDAFPGGIQTCFTPGKHYVAFDQNDFLTKAAFYLAHPDECMQICAQASHEVLQNHTWKHRIRKIVDDLNTL